jgi:hypothetical protein
MRFLVIIEGVPGGPPTPPEQMAPLVQATAKRMKESGRSEIQYAMADHAGGLMGGFCIHNVESAEQLAEDLATMPLGALSTFKVYPLVTMEASQKIIEGMLAQLVKK